MALESSLASDDAEDLVCSCRRSRAHKAFGHGIARTNDFGYEAGQNMCKQIPTDVSAALRILKSKKPR